MHRIRKPSDAIKKGFLKAFFLGYEYKTSDLIRFDKCHQIKNTYKHMSQNTHSQIISIPNDKCHIST